MCADLRRALSQWAGDERFVLFSARFSTNSQKARTALALKRADWSNVLVDLQQQEHLSDAYARLNPERVVPVLYHRGAIIGDSSVICEYVDEAIPAYPLSPADLLSRARMRQWMRFIEETVTPAIRRPTYQHLYRDLRKGWTEDELSRLRALAPIRGDDYAAMGRDGHSRSTLDRCFEKLAYATARMARTLREHRWLAGDRLSLADLAALPVVARLSALGREDLWNRHREIREWWARALAYDAIRREYDDAAGLGVEEVKFKDFAASV